MHSRLQSVQKVIIRPEKFGSPIFGLGTKKKEFEAEFGFIAGKKFLQ